jgi:hypothetical protein
MCGLLFAPPGTSIGKSILDRLSDWHHRSGENFDFFCVGYVTWNEFEDDKPVARIRDRADLSPIDFYYSARAFHDVRANVEAISQWKYSGEADLLLINAVQSEDYEDNSREYRTRSRLDLDEIVALDVDQIVRDGVFTTPAKLMERICQAADEAALSDKPLRLARFANRELARSLFRGTLSAVVDKLKIGTILGARHFIVGQHLLPG